MALLNMESRPGKIGCRSRLDAAPEFLLREKRLIQLLMSYLAVGLFFMLVPGTLVGVWNLLGISQSQSTSAASAAWIEGHGHAQLFGWITTFILGIGYYSLPNLRKLFDARFTGGWAILALWSSGVAIRWSVSIWPFVWQVLLPLSAVLELTAVVTFIAVSVRGHRSQQYSGRTVDAAAVAVIAGTLGLLIATLINTWQVFHVAFLGQSPVVSTPERLTLLTFAVWTFVVPVAWGLTAKWMPSFLGLQAYAPRRLLAAICANFLAALVSAAGFPILSAVIIVISVCLAISALKLCHRQITPAKTAGVHSSFPVFVRIAYFWLMSSSLLALIAACPGSGAGFAGASRHAVTVGFMSTLVFSVGPRVLPSFLGRTCIFSKGLMFAALLLLTGGCALRVLSQILAYEGIYSGAWHFLPVSALIELASVCLFMLNMLLTFRQPTHVDNLLA
jgi:hypothetical protein